jgi:hypothetical protein
MHSNFLSYLQRTRNFQLVVRIVTIASALLNRCRRLNESNGTADNFQT